MGIGGLSSSLETCMYWLEKAAMNGHVDSQETFSRMLLASTQKVYDGTYDTIGYSAVPRALYWARKAAITGNVEAVERVAALEKSMEKCAMCNKQLHKKSLKRCSRCKAVAFCGKDCQVKCWSMGHKRDCIDITKMDSRLSKS
jgi:hypothetical protein